tara:strand:- start:1155 stop:2102 length:948 start_codon:yes stop_codon:yes gene_type:complete
MKRILITGGAGFIGSHCVDLFHACGYEVGVFDIKSRAEVVNLHHILDDITYIEGDVRDVRQLDSVMGMYDVVLHMAAIVSVQESIDNPLASHETNVTGTLNVFDSASRHGVSRVVYASSAAVYGETEVVPTPEHAPLKPLSPYGLHKVINEKYGELYGQQFGLQNIGLRFFNVYGSRQDPSSPYSGVISIFAKYMQTGDQPTIFGDGGATRDFVHVSDVAAVCRYAIEADTTETFVCNIGSGKATSIRTLVDTFNTVLAAEVKPQHAAERTGDIVHSCSVSEVAYVKFSFRTTVPLHKGLKEVLDASQQDTRCIT